MGRVCRILEALDDEPPSHRSGARRHRTFDYANADAVYFVTIVVRNHRPLLADPRLAQVVVDCLHWLRTHKGIELYAYCVMADHLHLLLRAHQPLSDVIRSFKTYTTKQSWELGYQGTLWQKNFHDRILRRNEDARPIGEYIVANPIRKGLVSEVEEYPWSGWPDPM